MSSATYHSAIYNINPSKNTASRICFPGYTCDLLPQEIGLRELADLVTSMQKICFKDDNKDNKNSERIYTMFMDTSKRTVALAISLMYDANATDYTDFIDGGSATIQMSKENTFAQRQPWLNEVCRSKRVKGNKSPLPIIMDVIDKYITEKLSKRYKNINGLYLYVEKKPDHGDPVVLLKYYPEYGFKEFLLGGEVDEEYYYMKKCYGKDLSLLRKTKAKSTGISKKRKTNSTVKKAVSI